MSACFGMEYVLIVLNTKLNRKYFCAFAHLIIFWAQQDVCFFALVGMSNEHAHAQLTLLDRSGAFVMFC